MKPTVTPELLPTPATTAAAGHPGQSHRKHLWQGWAVLAGLVGMLIYARLNLPGPPCLLRTFFHFPCPGCGMTRSVVALSNLDFVTSFRYHPLGLPLTIAIFAWAIGSIGKHALTASTSSMKIGPQPRTRSNEKSYWWIALALLLTVWAVRIALSLSGNDFFLW